MRTCTRARVRCARSLFWRGMLLGLFSGSRWSLSGSPVECLLISSASCVPTRASSALRSSFLSMRRYCLSRLALGSEALSGSLFSVWFYLISLLIFFGMDCIGSVYQRWRFPSLSSFGPSGAKVSYRVATEKRPEVVLYNYIDCRYAILDRLLHMYYFCFRKIFWFHLFH